MKNLILFLATIFVSLNCFSQNQPPVAINDTVIVIHAYLDDTIIECNVLQNDYDPEGGPIEIFETESPYDMSSFTSNTIIDTIDNSFFINYSIKYRVRESDDTASVSDWASLYLDIRMDMNAPIALNDTIHNVFPGYDYFLNVLENDINTTGDSLSILAMYFPEINDSIVKINISLENNDYLYRVPACVLAPYFVSDTSPFFAGLFDEATMVIWLDNLKFYDSLNVNNANALFNCSGNHFWDGSSGPRGSRYYIPKESMLSSVFANSLWIGGLDDIDSIHVAADRYRNDGADYFFGPISHVYDFDYDKRWFRVWNLTRDEVDYHNANWWTTGYMPIQDIADWPGNGKVENGESPILAPFFDNNQNGIYEPLAGDCPRIKGDQMLFFIFNDLRSDFTESDGRKLGIEIHGMAYAFDKPEDSVLWNTTFVHYDIINRSDTTYHDTYLGVWSDISIGNPWDDFIGCDVQNGFYYGYNGDEEDENSTGPDGDELILGYGEHPPALGTAILGGPFLDSDDFDNPKYDGNGLQLCDFSINGLKFGDTIIDNERLGMTGFHYHNNSGGILGDPSKYYKYYNFLTCRWKDGTQLLYGGLGHDTMGAVGPECRFAFPGDSDTCNWGTDGVPPNGGYNQNGNYWTEITSGNNPSDRRGLGISGPFTFEAGETQSVDFAFVFARDYDGTAWSSVELLRDRVAYLKNLFEENEELFSSVKTYADSREFVQIYPNPAMDKITIYFTESDKLSFKNEFEIYNLQGLLIKKEIIGKTTRLFEVRLNELNTGMYLYILKNETGVLATGKLIKK